MSDRLTKEKEFHNKTFEWNTRNKAKKYYQAAAKSKDYYKKTLGEYSHNKDVLEYGCGPGSQAFNLAEKAKSVTGIDISDVAIRKAKEEARKRDREIEFRIMDAENLEFNSNTFDLICGSGILHHLNLIDSYSELSRVLKDEGIGIFYEPLGHNPFINLYRSFTPKMRTEDEKPLMMEDIKIAEKYFHRVNVHYFHLTTYLAGLVKNTSLFSPVVSTLNRIDTFLLKNFPVLKKFSWIGIIELYQPVDNK